MSCSELQHVVIWGVPYMGVPQNARFIVEKPIKRMMWRYPCLRKPPFCVISVCLIWSSFEVISSLLFPVKRALKWLRLKNLLGTVLPMIPMLHLCRSGPPFMSLKYWCWVQIWCPKHFLFSHGKQLYLRSRLLFNSWSLDIPLFLPRFYLTLPYIFWCKNHLPMGNIRAMSNYLNWSRFLAVSDSSCIGWTRISMWKSLGISMDIGMQKENLNHESTGLGIDVPFRGFGHHITKTNICWRWNLALVVGWCET